MNLLLAFDELDPLLWALPHNHRRQLYNADIFASHNQHKVLHIAAIVYPRGQGTLCSRAPPSITWYTLVGRTVFSCFTRSQISSARAILLATFGSDDLSNKAGGWLHNSYLNSNAGFSWVSLAAVRLSLWNMSCGSTCTGSLLITIDVLDARVIACLFRTNDSSYTFFPTMDSMIACPTSLALWILTYSCSNAIYNTM